uniref:Uncharacterized protein n=1 Tax=Magallana gigas TaxID=29159 RepID=K1RAB6_MAGGI
MKYLSAKFPQMDSYQCSYGLALTTPVSYPTQYFVHKENPACRRCGLVHHVGYCVARSSMCFNCGKDGHFARMCKTQKINRRSDVHAIKVTEKTDNSSQIEKRKSNKKIQRDRDRIRVFNEKRLFLAELPFSRIKDSQFNEELTKNKLDDAKRKINVLREDIDHQTAKAKFFENRHFVVLAELQKRDREIQQLEEQILHLSSTLRDREEELKEQAKTIHSRGHCRKTAVNSTHAQRRVESTSNWERDLPSSRMGRGGTSTGFHSSTFLRNTGTCSLGGRGNYHCVKCTPWT